MIYPAKRGIDFSKESVVPKRHAQGLETSGSRISSVRVFKRQQVGAQNYPGKLSALSQDSFKLFF